MNTEKTVDHFPPSIVPFSFSVLLLPVMGLIMCVYSFRNVGNTLRNR